MSCLALLLPRVLRGRFGPWFSHITCSHREVKLPPQHYVIQPSPNQSEGASSTYLSCHSLPLAGTQESDHDLRRQINTPELCLVQATSQTLSSSFPIFASFRLPSPTYSSEASFATSNGTPTNAILSCLTNELFPRAKLPAPAEGTGWSTLCRPRPRKSCTYCPPSRVLALQPNTRITGKRTTTRREVWSPMLPRARPTCTLSRESSTSQLTERFGSPSCHASDPTCSCLPVLSLACSSSLTCHNLRSSFS